MLNGACGSEAVDSQHGTGGGGSWHPCTKGYIPSKRFFLFYSYPHTCVEYCSMCCKNAIEHNGETKHAFILGSCNLVVNNKDSKDDRNELFNY
jgi:hypothetical protein